MPTRVDVVAAARRIAGRVHRTPVLTSRTIDAMLGAPLHFKCENLQRVGAYMKTVIEPSAAVTLAAMAENPGVARGRVGVILSGGNGPGVAL